MSFESILFESAADRSAIEKSEMPSFFTDLNLDQIVEAVVKGKQEYDLKPFFWSPLTYTGAIAYRHEVMRELEEPEPERLTQAFAKQMHMMRDYLLRSERLHYLLQRQRWFLDAVNTYCDAVTSLLGGLSTASLKSRGLLAFLEYLKLYEASEAFQSLRQETKRLEDELNAIDYRIAVKGKSITVRKSESEVDYSALVQKTFETFNQGETRDFRARFSESPEMNDIEAHILELVATLHRETFNDLDAYFQKTKDFVDGRIEDFDREVQFYLAYLEFIGSLKDKGLAFCYPGVSETSKEVSSIDGFDLALANKLLPEDTPVVCNDFYMKGNERVFVVSGPNQGGKTTFARTFGQLHYLASLGCPVPGKEARLFLCDNIFTHFEKEEEAEDLKSKLEADLIRIHSLLSEATPRSIVIANEILTSTTPTDAVFLGKKVLESLSRLDLLCVWVTFIEELATYNEKTVSMISMVTPEDPAIRTFKILRAPPPGLSYAAAIAEKHHLTYRSLKERIKP